MARHDPVFSLSIRVDLTPPGIKYSVFYMLKDMKKMAMKKMTIKSLMGIPVLDN
jgi:hypothetical protein